MKQFIKNNLKVITAVIISGIVFTGIGVYAASQYFARDIRYTPSNESFKKDNGDPIENVEDAINELYNKTNVESMYIAREKIGDVNLNFNHTNPNSDYIYDTQTATIDVKSIYNYNELTVNNFIYEINNIFVGYPDVSSNWCYSSEMNNKPILTYDSENGIVMISVTVRNGYHDYIDKMKFELFVVY